jgi:hypothetical protein
MKVSSSYIAKSNNLFVGFVFFIAVGASLFLSFTQPSECYPFLFLIALILAASILLKKHVYLLSTYNIIIFAIFASYFVRPLYLVRDKSVLSFAPGIERVDLVIPLLLASLFCFCFSVGHFSSKVLASTISNTFAFPYSCVIRKPRFLPALIILFIFACACYLIMLRMAGSSFVSAIADPFAFRISSSSGGSFYVSAFALWSLWSIFYVLYIRFLGIPGAQRSDNLSYKRIVLAIVFAIIFTLSIPFGSRGYLLVPILSILWMQDNSRSPSVKPINAFVLIPVAILMISFSGFFGVYRQAGISDLSLSQVAAVIDKISLDDLVEQFAVRFDSFDFFASIVDRCTHNDCDYLYGRSLADFLVQPIPRSLMPDKVYKTSALLTQTYFPSLPHTFTPEYGLITELFINIGALGVAMGGVVLGVFTRVVDLVVSSNSSNVSFMLFCLPIILTPLGFFLAGFNSDTSIMFIMNSLLSLVLVSFLYYPKRSLTSAS